MNLMYPHFGQDAGGYIHKGKVNHMSIIKPENYKSPLSLKDTQIAIKMTKDFFETNLAKELNLVRVSAPLFVDPKTGLNDNLNGVERPVSFDVKETGKTLEIVHSLAKWKRYALKYYGFNPGEGLYTDMNAIRRDEDTDNLHSIYVDQWDWEKVIEKSERTPETLKDTVKKIFKVFKNTEKHICDAFPSLSSQLPEDITFITTQELEDLYPDKTPKERENLYVREKKAIFLAKIGDILNSGEKHDGRAPDYDDWELNGDIIFYNETLDCAYEVSSMGIRVSEESLMAQLEKSNCLDRVSLPFHKDLLEGKLPYTIGGGLGQSRICMFVLKKAHIGEVQASVWPENMIKECSDAGISIL